MIEYFKNKHGNDIKHALLNEETNWNTKDSLHITGLFSLLKDLGCCPLGDTFETNGWQYDFWFDFTFGSGKYTVSGGSYYGGLCIYSKEE